MYNSQCYIIFSIFYVFYIVFSVIFMFFFKKEVELIINPEYFFLFYMAITFLVLDRFNAFLERVRIWKIILN